MRLGQRAGRKRRQVNNRYPTQAKNNAHSEGRPGISTYEKQGQYDDVRLLYGLLLHLEIPGSRVEAKRDDRVTIRSAQFVK